MGCGFGWYSYLMAPLSVQFVANTIESGMYGALC